MRAEFKKAYVPKRKRVAKKAVKVSAPLRSAIKKVITGKAEKKFTTRFYVNPLLPGSDIIPMSGPIVSTGGFSGFYPLIPPVQIGPGQNERVGDQINPTHLEVNVTVVASDLGSALDVVGRIMIVEDKTTNSQDFASTSLPDASILLDSGGNAHDYDGTLSWQSLPINRSRYTVHKDITYRTQKTAGAFQSFTNLMTSTQVVATNNTHHHFRIRVPCKKTYKYQDQTASYPSNQALWLAIGFCNLNGVPATPSPNVSMALTSTMYYTDT